MHATHIVYSKHVFDGIHPETFDGGIAIHGDTIIAAGNRPSLARYTNSETMVEDLGDAMLAPGFIDPHMHMDLTSLNASGRQCLELFQAKSAEECVRMIAAFAEANPHYGRIVGTGWDKDNWLTPDTPLNKGMLDAVIAHKPVYLFDGCLHTVWCNSAALQEMGINAQSKVNFGRIAFDEHGEPTGMLYESEAISDAYAFACTLGDISETAEVYHTLYQQLSELGITSVCSVSAVAGLTSEIIPEYECAVLLDQQGRLPLRLFLFPSLGTEPDAEKWLNIRKKYQTRRVAVAGLKQFVDGILHQKTAYFKQPYENEQSECGAPFLPPTTYNKLVGLANSHGFPVRLHAIGDAAVVTAIEAFEYSQKLNGDFSFYNSIEHANCMDMADMDRLKNIQVVLSTQPTHILNNLPAYVAKVGQARADKAYPVNSFARAGLALAIGSDAPAASFNPLETLHAAVTRKNHEGKTIGKNSHECLSIFEALRAHMLGAACCANMQHRLGTLESGKLADIIALDTNLLTCDVDAILNAKVLRTICGGATVFQR